MRITFVPVGERSNMSMSSGLVCVTPLMEMLETVTPEVGRPLTVIALGYGETPPISLIVMAPPEKLTVTLSGEAANGVPLPWQMLALVGVIVGTAGGVPTMISTSSVLAVQGLLLMVQR